jgi:hypothetical protein
MHILKSVLPENIRSEIPENFFSTCNKDENVAQKRAKLAMLPAYQPTTI